MLKIEICINCDNLLELQTSVKHANQANASRIELCSNMQLGGLTPDFELLKSIRNIFKPKGMLVMIRPRSGNFVYSGDELERMKQQIEMANRVGADGVVFGILREDHSVDEYNAKQLIGLCKALNLQTTFHRAFDATTDIYDSLNKIVDFGFDRILTSGTSWLGGGTVMDGIKNLKKIITMANNRIEIVIGGGINNSLLGKIIKEVDLTKNISFHSYSGVLNNGVSDYHKIKQLVDFELD